MPAVEVDPYDVTTFPRPQPWTDDAACLTSDPALFFADDPGSIAEAKATCRPCPVRENCLREALAHDDVWGVRGGMTGGERRRLLISGGAA